MSYMSSSERAKCHTIIHTASASAAAIASGLAQLPGSDNALIAPIQMTMIISLGRVFDIEVTKSALSTMAAALTAKMMGRAVSQVLFGWMPILGNTMNAATAAAITESNGWEFAHDFAKEAAQIRGARD